MFVWLSKTLDLALEPLTWSATLVVLGLLLRGRRRLGPSLIAGGVLVLAVFSSEPVADGLMRVAEASAVSTWRAGRVYDVAVVLSGEVEPTSERTGRLELNGAADRMVAGYDLLRRGEARHVLLSGGPAFAAPGQRTEPELVADELVGWGIDPSRLVLEEESRNTHENAVAAARIVAARGWSSVLLVTSAAHMERALGCFRKAGMSPDALPVDRRAGGELREWAPRARSLWLSTEALRELAGRLVYRVMGYT